VRTSYLIRLMESGLSQACPISPKVVNVPEAVDVTKPPVLTRPSDQINGNDDDERGLTS
jgi:hypothetical protein